MSPFSYKANNIVKFSVGKLDLKMVCQWNNSKPLAYQYFHRWQNDYFIVGMFKVTFINRWQNDKNSMAKRISVSEIIRRMNLLRWHSHSVNIGNPGMS